MSTEKQQEFIRPSSEIWKKKGGANEIITRSLVVLFTTIPLAFLSATVGLNNALYAAILNDEFDGYNSSSIEMEGNSRLGQAYVYNSVNLFCGIFIAFIAIGMIYQLILVAIRFLNFAFINNNIWILCIVDVIFNYVMTFVMLAGACGCYVTIRTIDYRVDYGEPLDTNIFPLMKGFLWAAFGFFISSSGQTLGLTYTMSRCYYGCRGNQKKCNNNNNNNNNNDDQVKLNEVPT